MVPLVSNGGMRMTQAAPVAYGKPFARATPIFILPDILRESNIAGTCKEIAPTHFIYVAEVIVTDREAIACANCSICFNNGEEPAFTRGFAEGWLTADEATN